jgi:Ca2+-binding RTX toxin-like protein
LMSPDTGRKPLFTVLMLFIALLAALLLLANTTPRAIAGSIAVDTSPGTAAPPVKLGPYLMAPFGADGRPDGQEVRGVRAPGGAGILRFGQPLDHRRVGDSWATWSHGYRGDVYFTNGRDQVVMTLPESTKAFYFYAEPNDFSTFTVRATANDGSESGSVAVRGRAGAKYFGFYTTGSSSVRAVTVTVDPDAQGFAVGEFGIYSAKCTISGTKGADVLLGTRRDDTICGLGSNDSVLGRSGGDVLRGGGGNDVLRGGGGKDIIQGQSGTDILRGDRGDDTLDARDGVRANDLAHGGSGRDVCVSDRQDTTISCIFH